MFVGIALYTLWTREKIEKYTVRTHSARFRLFFRLIFLRFHRKRPHTFQPVYFSIDSGADGLFEAIPTEKYKVLTWTQRCARQEQPVPK